MNTLSNVVAMAGLIIVAALVVLHWSSLIIAWPLRQ